MRRNSLTSSQSNAAFTHAFPSFQASPAWIAVAEYLFGFNYRGHFNFDENNDGNSSSDDDSNGNTEEKSLEDFIEELVHTEDDNGANVAAFNFIRPFILENETIEDEDEAYKIAYELSKPTFSAVIELLSGRVPPSQQKKLSTENSQQKEFARWLQSTNSRREYLFHSTNSLKNLVSSKNVRIKGRKTIDRMIDALAGIVVGSDEGESLRRNDPLDEAIKAIISKSFLPHQKGETREACSMGHILERPIFFLKNG